MESAAPARSGPPRLVQREVGVESALSHWSRPFRVGVSVESGVLGWSQLFSLNQRGVSGSGVESSAWSRPFRVGVRLESGVSGRSQRGAGAESAACGPWAVGPWAVLII